eukprot:TRINITY_DN61478_c0_g1_i1.p1 TRINITY_DN61478_c0_g1~~TRINITY_DN61478_c0_g1_i1.p1  ORF type:complete len:493 (-),score=48.65 TRINITY_DN61478_c0_g1_i1:120-1598(-)
MFARWCKRVCSPCIAVKSGCGACLFAWATQRRIILWMVFEQLLCVCLIFLVVHIPEIVFSSWVFDFYYGRACSVFVFSIRLVLSMMGARAAYRRKVQSTKLYLFCHTFINPIVFLLAIQLLMNTSCSCFSPHFDSMTGKSGYDFAQCDIVRGFSGRAMTNVVPNYRVLKRSPSKLPYVPRDKWPAPFEYVPALYTPRTRKSAAAIADWLSERRCTCAGEVFGKEQRSSCNLFYDSARKRYEGWCFLRDFGNSLQKCAEVLGESNIFVDNVTGKPWSFSLCSDIVNNQTVGLKPCACSERGLISDFATADWSFGEKCKVWGERLGGPPDKNYSLPWCWAGFDTTCPDSLNTERWSDNPYMIDFHRVNPTTSASFETLSQFLSFQPCQKGIRHKAKLWCHAVVHGLAVPVMLALVLTFPLIVILLSFLQNRCSDFLPHEPQFTVHFSSSDDEDGSSARQPAPKFSNQRASLQGAAANKRASLLGGSEVEMTARR